MRWLAPPCYDSIHASPHLDAAAPDTGTELPPRDDWGQGWALPTRGRDPDNHGAGPKPEGRGVHRTEGSSEKMVVTGHG